MKLFIGIFVVICLELITIDTNELENSSPINPIAFAFHLYEETIKSTFSENCKLVISPLSIQMCLVVAFLGAEGRTAEELSSGLYLGTLNKQAVANSFKNLLKSANENSLITIVNKIYLQNGLAINETFRNFTRDVFDTNIRNLDLHKSIENSNLMNEWIESETNNKIQNLIKPEYLTSDVVALLANAIYFRGKWQKPFTLGTLNRTFWLEDQNSVNVPMMFSMNNYKYAELVNLNAFAVEMPYNNSDISMLVIVPNDKNGLKQLEKNLKSINLSDIGRQLDLKHMMLILPKFKSEFSINLNNILKNMNMQTMFSNEADFSVLANSRIKVSKVIHKAIVVVDEYGTEEVASTYENHAGPSCASLVTVDRPFLYFIRDENVIYFMGNVTKF